MFLHQIQLIPFKILNALSLHEKAINTKLTQHNTPICNAIIKVSAQLFLTSFEFLFLIHTIELKFAVILHVSFGLM